VCKADADCKNGIPCVDGICGLDGLTKETAGRTCKGIVLQNKDSKNGFYWAWYWDSVQHFMLEGALIVNMLTL
jgi:hypothetical protein